MHVECLLLPLEQSAGGSDLRRSHRAEQYFTTFAQTLQTDLGEATGGCASGCEGGCEVCLWV